MQYFIALSLLPACANISKTESKKTSTPVLRQRQAVAEMRKKEESKQNAMDKKQLLSKKRMRAQAPLAISPKMMTAANKMSEKDLYAEILQTFHGNNELAFRTYSVSLKKRFPQSLFLDDAIYLSGLLALENKQYGEALVSLNQVLNKYPNSNRAPAALYAKAVTLKKMSLVDESKQVFSQVLKVYPGSPESFRAKADLSLIK